MASQGQDKRVYRKLFLTYELRCSFYFVLSGQRRRRGLRGVLEDEGARVGRRGRNVELHAQLGVELVVERPLRGDVAVAQLARHGCLQAAPEMHLHLRAHCE